MNTSSNNPGGRRKLMRYFCHCLFFHCRWRNLHLLPSEASHADPSCLNQPTKAREVRPFSTKARLSLRSTAPGAGKAREIAFAKLRRIPAAW